MKHSCFIIIATLFSCIMLGCMDKKNSNEMLKVEEKTSSEPDTTIYGVCGEGTAMHTLQLITDVGDTLEFALLDKYDMQANVQGGLMSGDRVAVVGADINGERVASKVINVTTLLGKWVSLDKNFEIEEGGTVKSNVKAETKSWTSWKIFNGHLLLNKDTFDIISLGADSLYLENNNGIFVYKRQQ